MDRPIADRPGFTIRSATHRDARGILACLAAAFEPFRDRYTPDGFRDTVLSPATLEQRLSQMTVLVAVTGSGEVIGTIGHQLVDRDEGHIRGMAVLPDWQGLVVAPALLAAVEAELRGRGCVRASLDTTEPLARAINFYENHGYRPTGTVEDFFGMPLFEYVKKLG